MIKYRDMETKDGYIAFIINPKSGPSGSKLTARKFSQYLMEKGFAVKKTFTKSLYNACELAENAGRDPDCALAVVVGGDGTVSEVATGLEGSETPLIIVPSGTENLLANELGFDERLKTIIKAFEDNNPKPLDLGCVNNRCFTSITGCGFDGRVVKLLSENREGNIDYFDYFWPLWRTYWDYDFPPMKVTVDGEQIFEGRCLVFVGNISRYAMGLEILKNADYGDGLLDVCIYKCSSRVRLIKQSMITVLRCHTRCSDVVYRQGRNITISSVVRGILSEIDGDPGPALPLNIKVIPHAVKVMVPKDAKPAGIRTRIVRTIG